MQLPSPISSASFCLVLALAIFRAIQSTIEMRSPSYLVPFPPFFYIHPLALPYCSCHTFASNFPLKWALQSLSSFATVASSPTVPPSAHSIPKKHCHTFFHLLHTEEQILFCLSSKASLKPVSIIQLATYQSQCSQIRFALITTNSPFLLLSQSFSEAHPYPDARSLKENSFCAFISLMPYHSILRASMQWNQIIPQGFSCEGNGLHNLFHVGSWSVWEWVWVPANSAWFQATQWPVQTRSIILSTHCLHLRLVWFQSSFQTQSQQRQHQIHWSQHQTPTDFQLGCHPQLDRHLRVTSAQRNCCSGHSILCGYHHGNLITHQTQQSRNIQLAPVAG